MKIRFMSGNKHKIAEVQRILTPVGVDILRLQLLDLSGYRHDLHTNRGEDALHLRDLVLVVGHESNLQVSPSMSEKLLATSYCCCMSQMDSPSAMAAPWSSAKPR